MTKGQAKVFFFIRDRFDETGRAPTLAEIGEHFGYTTVAAWKHVQELIKQGKLERGEESGRSLQIVGRVDLSPVSTTALRAELRRRKAQPQDIAA